MSTRLGPNQPKSENRSQAQRVSLSRRGHIYQEPSPVVAAVSRLFMFGTIRHTNIGLLWRRADRKCGHAIPKLVKQSSIKSKHCNTLHAVSKPTQSDLAEKLHQITHGR